MLRYCSLSSLNIKVGKAKDAVLINGDDTFGHEFTCIPVSLRFDLWEVKGISFLIKVEGSNQAETELFSRGGKCLDESINGTYTLDWRNSKGYIALAFVSDSIIFIGNTVRPINLPHKESYPITLEVWHSDDLITDSHYTLKIIDGKMCLSDVEK